MMKDQMRRGFNKALDHKGMSKRSVSLKAGVNENLLAEYLRGDGDIYMKTVESLCVNGLGMSFNEVWILGQMGE